jgi:hypothetical protein
MSTIRTKKPHASAERLSPITEQSPNTPYMLLWATGVFAFVLCAVAFVLWGIAGTRILFDVIVALCS